MPNNNSKTILDQIVDAKVVEVSKQKELVPQNVLEGSISHALPPVSMSKALSRIDNIALLAEIKKASPSKGLLCPDFNHITLAHTYAANGASGISILTDPRFQGELQHLYDIKQSATIQSLPVLRKDIIIDEYQNYESRANIADCILLIVAILSPNELKTLHSLANNLGMDVIVEIHNQAELDTALKMSPAIIGINNRDLRTFETDINTTLRLCEKIPEDIVVISESGINTTGHIKTLSKHNIDAILVGEALVTSNDIPAKIKSLIYPSDAPTS